MAETHNNDNDDSGAEHLLEKLSFKELVEIAKVEKLNVKGKKKQVLARILKEVSDAKIREHYRAARGAKVDISGHTLVPKHEIIKKEDVEKVTAQFHCTVFDLPKILDTDPMVLKIGAKPGDVIRITRDSATAGWTYYYRHVVRSVD